jgi:hypothetical protein
MDSATIQFELFGDRLQMTRDFIGGPLGAPVRPYTPDATLPKLAGSDIEGGATFLDRTVAGFHATNEPTAEVFDRVIWAMSIRPGGGGRGFAPDGPELVPTSLTYDSPVTVRELLNGLCRVRGGLSWELRQSYNKESVDLTLLHRDGWRITRRLQVPAGGLP